MLAIYHDTKSLLIVVFILSLGVYCGCGTKSNNGNTNEDTSTDAAEDLNSPDFRDLTGDLTETSTDVFDPGVPDHWWVNEYTAPQWPVAITDNVVLSKQSPWSFRLDRSDPLPEGRFLPDLGVGNGSVFALLGYAIPINTLHSMVGPTYDKGDGFYSDTWLELGYGKTGKPLNWQSQWISRVEKTPIVLTMEQGPAWQLATVNVAPVVSEAKLMDSVLARTFVRQVVVKNYKQDKLTDVWVHVRFARPQEVQDGLVFETRPLRKRLAMVKGVDDVQADNEGLHVSLGDIALNEEKIFYVIYITDNQQAKEAETLVAAEAMDFDKVTKSTSDYWNNIISKSLTLETPDELVNSFIETQKLVVLTQQAATGATCPMSEYTRTWLRDTAGPVRFLISVGLFEQIKDMLDYQFKASCMVDEIRNSYSAEMVFPEELPQPDWLSKGPISGHARAESPSYLVLNHYWYWQATGDLDFMKERKEFLLYALKGQGFEGSVLPFSGDETYRTAMAVAHSLEVDEQFTEGFVSANSSFLWAAAAEIFIKMIQDSEFNDIDYSWLEPKIAEVRAGVDDVFLLENGAYSPYATWPAGEKSEKLFEDVSTQPLWVDYLDRFDPKAITNLKVAIETIGGDDGDLISPLPAMFEDFMGLELKGGIYTGMMPGYYLANLAVTHHPLGETAFNRIPFHATATGTIGEYQVLDFGTPLQLVYDSLGAIGDYTARYRPWEGGIVAESVISYLLGLRINAPENILTVSPKLPNNWPSMNVRNIRIGDSYVDLKYSKTRSGHRLEVALTSGSGVTVVVEMPGSCAETGIANGEIEELDVDAPWLTNLCRSGPLVLSPDQGLTIDMK